MAREAGGADRARHGLRIGFAALAFALAAAGLILADRSGAPERLIMTLALGLVLAGAALMGLIARTMQMSRFYAMRTNLAPVYAGLAGAALLFAMALPLLPGLHAPAAELAQARGLFAAALAGTALGALAVWPLLRATQAFSITDLLTARFPGWPFRLLTAGISGLVSALVAQSGFDIALRAATDGTDIAPGAAAPLLALALGCACVPGGLRGAFALPLTAGGFLLAALAGGVVFLTISGPGEPMAVVSGAMDDAGRELAQTLAAAPAGLPMFAVSALGFAALPPLTQCGLACGSGGGARRAGFSVLAWCLPLFAAGLFLAAYSAGHGAAPPPGGVDVEAGGAWLLTAFASIAGASPALRGLSLATFAALGLALAAMGLQSFATAVGHDSLYRRGGKLVLTSARLAMTRLVMIGALIFMTLVGISGKFEPRAALGLAIALSAAAFAPMLALAYWQRASRAQAFSALAAGLGCFLVALAGQGLSLAYADLADAALVGLAGSLLTGLFLGLTSRARAANREAARGLRSGYLPALLQRPGA